MLYWKQGLQYTKFAHVKKWHHETTWSTYFLWRWETQGTGRKVKADQMHVWSRSNAGQINLPRINSEQSKMPQRQAQSPSAETLTLYQYGSPGAATSKTKSAIIFSISVFIDSLYTHETAMVICSLELLCASIKKCLTAVTVLLVRCFWS